jgi:hypothetical protein
MISSQINLESHKYVRIIVIKNHKQNNPFSKIKINLIKKIQICIW